MKYALTALAVIFALIWGAWLIVVPGDMIEDKIESSLTQGGLSLQAKGFGKGLFYSIRIEALEVYRDDRLLLSVYEFRVAPDWPALLSLRAGVRFSGELAGGTVKGSASSDGEDHSLALKAKNVQLALSEIHELTGQKIEGTVEAEMKFSGTGGSGTFKARGLRAMDASVQGFKIPREVFHTARGAFSIEGNVLEVTSLALEGEGIYARLSGTVRPALAELKLEIMPEAQELEVLLSAALGMYKASPGHYVVPIKRPL
ncbi:MAG: type II secretion system protein GspN [Thermodesulfovibrionales bacterium]|nr:type II secretion system protein GspN [Thermodesulfovibrionales bacterium]